MPSLHEKVKLLADEFASVRDETWVRDAEVVTAFLEFTLAAMDSDPAAGCRLAKTARQIAIEPCDHVQVLGLLAQYDRSQGHISQAMAKIEAAFELGEDCPSCVADLYRRKANVYLYQERFDDAVAAASRAIQLYQALGHKGHDLQGNGLASSYLARGQIHHFAKTHDAAIEDIGRCLTLINPSVSRTLHRVSVHNLAWALLRRGRQADLLLADKHLRTARQLFRRKVRRSQEQAKLAWLTAMVRQQLGKEKPYRIRRYLEQSRRDLLGLGFVPDAAAITADLARVSFPDRAKIAAALEALEEQAREFGHKLSAEIEEAIVGVRRAFHVRGWNGADELKESIEALREACGPEVMACLITWPSIR